MFTHAFIILCVSVFIVFMGAGIIAPVLPLYVKELGASGLALGVVYSSVFISMGAVSPIVGRIIDRFGKKGMIVSGFGIGSVIALSYVWATGAADLIVIRLCQGIIVTMISPVAMAYIGQLSPQGQEGTFMGVYGMMLIMGMATGPLLGGKFADAWGMDSVFYAFAAAMGICFLLTLFLLPEQKPVSFRNASRYPLREILKIKPLKGLFVVSFTLAIAQSGLILFVPLLAWRLQFSMTQIGILASCFAFVYGIFQVPFGKLANRFNKAMLIVLGITGMAGGIACLPFAQGFYALVFLCIFIGTAAAFSTPAANAMIVENSRDIGMGTAIGTWNMFNNLGMIIGPIAAGITMDQVNLDSVFYLYTIIFLSSAGVFYLLTKK